MQSADLRAVIKHTDPFSIQNTLKELIRDAKSSKPNFNYNPAREIQKKIFSGDISIDQIRAFCKNPKNAVATRCNTDAAEKLYEAIPKIRAEPVICHPYKNKRIAVPYSQDKAVTFNIPFFYVRNGKVHIPWTQFSKGDHYSEFQIRLVLTILKQSFDEEFDDVEVLFIDLRVPTGEALRNCTIHSSSDIQLCTKQEIDSFFNVYLSAKKLFDEMQIERVHKVRERKIEIEPTLFDSL